MVYCFCIVFTTVAVGLTPFLFAITAGSHSQTPEKPTRSFSVRQGSSSLANRQLTSTSKPLPAPSVRGRRRRSSVTNQKDQNDQIPASPVPMSSASLTARSTPQTSAGDLHQMDGIWELLIEKDLPASNIESIAMPEALEPIKNLIHAKWFQFRVRSSILFDYKVSSLAPDAPDMTLDEPRDVVVDGHKMTQVFYYRGDTLVYDLYVEYKPFMKHSKKFSQELTRGNNGWLLVSIKADDVEIFQGSYSQPGPKRQLLLPLSLKATPAELRNRERAEAIQNAKETAKTTLGQIALFGFYFGYVLPAQTANRAANAALNSIWEYFM